MQKSREDVASLTGIRFFAAMAVLFPHALINLVFVTPSNGVAVLGALSAPAMTLFFVLSGFVLQYRYSGVIGQPGGIRLFFVARFARLYPLYAVLLLIGIPIVAALPRSPAPLEAALPGLPFFLAGIQSWVPLWLGDTPLIYTNYLALSWSISTEFFFYLFFPLISPLIVIAMRVLPAYLVAAAAVLVPPFVLPHIVGAEWSHTLAAMVTPTGTANGFQWWLQYISPYVRIFDFIAGVAIGQLYLVDHARREGKAERVLAAVAFAVALAAFALLHWSLFTSSRIEIEIVVPLTTGVLWYAIPLSIALYAIARYGFFPALSNPWVVALGAASYSIYLAHPLMIAVIRQPYMIFSWTQSSIPFQLGMLLFTLVAIPLASVFIHRRFENPARIFLRRLLTTGLAKPHSPQSPESTSIPRLNRSSHSATP